MNTSTFDEIYSQWSQELPKTIQDIINKNAIGNLPVDEKDIADWASLLSEDSTKYDILMWLKAKANTSFVDNGSIPFTEKVAKASYKTESMEEGDGPNFISSFKTGMKRHKKYYNDELFKYVMPPLFMCVYSNNNNANYNPFCKNNYSEGLKSFLLLKNDLENNAKIYINMITDAEIKECQEITMAYYLENTYGFEIKKILAHKLSQTPASDTIFKPDHFEKVLKKVIPEFFEGKNVQPPEKYKNLNINSLLKQVRYSSTSEYEFLKDSTSTNEYKDIELSSKTAPGSGYLLMVLLFVRSVLLSHMQDINNCLNNADTKIDGELVISINAIKYITEETQNLVENILNELSFSIPGHYTITYDEEFLLSNIDKICAKTPVKNEEFCNEPEFKKKIIAMAKSRVTGEECNIQDLGITIMMPCESGELISFLKHFQSAFAKIQIYRLSHCNSKDTKKISNLKEYYIKNGIDIGTGEIVRPKLSGTEVRTCKNLIIKLMKNCFNAPTIAEYNEDPKLSYIVRELPTKSKILETTFEDLKTCLSAISSDKCNLISLRNSTFDSYSSNILYNMFYFFKYIIDDCLDVLYKMLISSFDNPSDYKKNISGIYNSEVIEHIKENLSYNEIIDFSKIDQKLQKEIANYMPI